ncbi:MAG: hypothetical protein M1269_10730 [Chloroflexi bacterium]|nr:hypothetical protein [Chloroflexota bacterium]
MNCSVFKTMMPDYETESLPGTTRLKWEEHLKSCAGCRLEWEEWMKTARLLDLHEEIEPEADFMPRLYVKLAMEDRKPRPESGVLPWFLAFPKAGMAIAGLLLVLGITWFAWSGLLQHNTPVPAVTQAAVSAPAAISEKHVADLKNFAGAGNNLLPEKIPAYNAEETPLEKVFAYDEFGNIGIDLVGEKDIAQLILDENRR